MSKPLTIDIATSVTESSTSMPSGFHLRSIENLDSANNISVSFESSISTATYAGTLSKDEKIDFKKRIFEVDEIFWDAQSETAGSTEFTITLAMAATDTIDVCGITITAYNGSVGGDPYGIDITVDTTIAQQITTIKAMTIADITISGAAADEAVFTQTVAGTGDYTAAVKAGTVTISGVATTEYAVPNMRVVGFIG